MSLLEEIIGKYRETIAHARSIRDSYDIPEQQLSEEEKLAFSYTGEGMEERRERHLSDLDPHVQVLDHFIARISSAHGEE